MNFEYAGKTPATAKNAVDWVRCFILGKELSFFGTTTALSMVAQLEQNLRELRSGPERLAN
jgi:hypothetical protein